MLPTILTLSTVFLTVLGLGFYTVHKMTPGSFRVQTSVWRIFSFRVEIESKGWTEAKVIPPRE
jgi:hypothetical protein